MTLIIVGGFTSLTIYFDHFYERSKINDLTENLNTFITHFDFTEDTQAAITPQIRDFNNENNADLSIYRADTKQFYSFYDIFDFSYSNVLMGLDEKDTSIDIMLTPEQMILLPEESLEIGAKINVNGQLENGTLIPNSIDNILINIDPDSNFTGVITLIDNYDTYYSDVTESFDNIYFSENDILTYGTGDLLDSTVQTATSNGIDYMISQIMFTQFKQVDFVKQTDIQGISFSFMVNASLQPITEAARVIQYFLPYFVAIAFVLSIVVALFYSKYITRPIRVITASANKMSNLDFSEKLNISRKDELGILSDSINHLSSNLESSLNDLSLAHNQLQIEFENEMRQEAARKDFVANVSHEIKSPLGVIKSYSEGIRDAVKKDKINYYLDVILDEVESMDHLVIELLNLAKYDAGKIKFNPQTISLEDELKKCIAYHTGEFKEKSQTILLFGHFKEISGDTHKLMRVFNNLIANAIKYAPEHADLKIQGAISNDQQLLRISNPSEFIDAPSLLRLWDRFYKLDESHTRDHSGSGLGLSIVKSILELHEAKYQALYENGQFIIEIKFKI